MHVFKDKIRCVVGIEDRKVCLYPETLGSLKVPKTSELPETQELPEISETQENQELPETSELRKKPEES